MHRGRRHVHDDVRVHVHGWNLPYEYGLDQYQCQFHDCDGDDDHDRDDQDHRVQQN